MQTTLENKKKVIANFLRSAFKRKNRVEEGGALGSGVKREQESTNLRAQKMMKGKVEPFTVLVEQLRRKRYIQDTIEPQKRGPRKKFIRGNLRTRKGGSYFSTRRRDIQNTTFGNRTTNEISGGGDRNCRAKCRYKTIGLCVDWDYKMQ